MTRLPQSPGLDAGHRGPTGTRVEGANCLVSVQGTKGAGTTPPVRVIKMATPARIEVVRRAYRLWEQAGKPDGRDQEFYLQAERELQEALDKEIAGDQPGSTSTK
jgi:Protein of unknown function (DUF2934)